MNREVLSQATRTLEGLDPLLSIRWSERLGKYVIDRRAVVTDMEISYMQKRLVRINNLIAHGDLDLPTLSSYKKKACQIFEELESAKAKRRIILFCDHWGQDIYNALCLSDMNRYGGYSGFMDEVERKEAAAEEELEKRHASERDDIHREALSMTDFLERRRQNMLSRGEKDLEKLLRG